jgi:hypothetical protein
VENQEKFLPDYQIHVGFPECKENLPDLLIGVDVEASFES